ncbi:MAG: hypothetical protein Ct9H300mP20_17640 [Gammaproteobacteria bacterium]|nr:MAG: hypothetical protein Ct9H300mP20_17640 [Gammaproteobacteria bacterium]
MSAMLVGWCQRQEQELLLGTGTPGHLGKHLLLGDHYRIERRKLAAKSFQIRHRNLFGSKIFEEAEKELSRKLEKTLIIFLYLEIETLLWITEINCRTSLPFLFEVDYSLFSIYWCHVGLHKTQYSCW